LERRQKHAQFKELDVLSRNKEFSAVVFHEALHVGCLVLPHVDALLEASYLRRIQHTRLHERNVNHLRNLQTQYLAVNHDEPQLYDEYDLINATFD
jgi:hypothetical protein